MLNRGLCGPRSVGPDELSTTQNTDAQSGSFDWMRRNAQLSAPRSCPTVELARDTYGVTA